MGEIIHPDLRPGHLGRCRHLFSHHGQQDIATLGMDAAKHRLGGLDFCLPGETICHVF